MGREVIYLYFKSKTQHVSIMWERTEFRVPQEVIHKITTFLKRIITVL
jgi:hypothetical protein